jgi:Domain of unknown function DUF11
MRFSRLLRFALPAVLAASWVGCHNSDTTTAPGSLANVTVTGPGSASSGQSFTMNVAATAVGINSVQNAVVTVMIPSQCAVTNLDASGGTSATTSGGTVTWTIGSLSSNSQSQLHITVTGTLPPNSGAQTVTFQATLTANGITAGSAVASASVQINP